MSRPSSNTRPRFGGRKPVIALNSVVLPAPFGPINPVIQLASTDKDAASTAVSPPKMTVTASTSSNPTSRPPGRDAAHIVADAERAVDQQYIGLHERLGDAELADLGLGVLRLHLCVLAARVIPPG